jgi:RimJ/RimL family protein N-acetyltransferase
MPKPAVSIVVITTDTFSAWREMRLRALHDHPDAFGQPYASYAAIAFHDALAQFEARYDEGSVIFGAFSGNELSGTIGIFREQRPKAAHQMTIVAMYVIPEARGTGVSDALVTAAIAEARATSGVLQIHLAVASHNIAARKLYERHGFVRYGTEPRALLVDGQPYDEDHMVLILDNYAISSHS